MNAHVRPHPFQARPSFFVWEVESDTPLLRVTELVWRAASANGVGTVEACTLVETTIDRWHGKRGWLPPLRRVKRERSERYLIARAAADSAATSSGDSHFEGSPVARVECRQRSA